jgi:acyl-CoA dehydrogenase
MSEMQEMIIESTTKIMEKFSTKEVINDAENGQWAGELWNSLVEYGMLGVAVPEELGGCGGDYADALSILQIAGRYSAPIPLSETYLANWILSGYGESITDEIITIANFKDVQPLRLTKSGEGWTVSGQVNNVPWARFSEKILVLGDTEEGSVLALINLTKAQVVNGKNLAGEARDKVFFDGVFVEECKIISVDRDEAVKKVLYGGALTRSVMMAGALENIFDLTVQHTTERSQFGRPLHRFQAIQHQLALLAGEVAAADLAAKYAVNSYCKNPFSKEIAYSKIRVNEAAGKTNPIAHQVFAAIGFTYEHTLHHSTRRLWSWRDEFGTETDWEWVVTEELLNMENNGLWSLITGVTNNEKKVEVK